MNKNSGIDIMVSFDTTGSMYPCLSEVRENIEGLATKLFKEIPDLRIAIMAHGDYCDKATYVTKTLDFTRNLHDVVQFVRKVDPTYGGDYPECYELVLHEMRGASWSAERARVAVVIADAVPHEVGRRDNESGYDWRNEARMLKATGVQVYAVQCLNVSSSSKFYKELASLTDGLHLHLHQFRHIENLLTGIAYKLDSEDKLNSFEEQIRQQGGYTRQVEGIFDTLAGRTAKKYALRADGLVPVDPARFQIFDVTGKEPSIRDFVESRGITFKKGRGFYPHITRSEMIQENKEVILEDLTTGELFTGDEAREMIGLPYGSRGMIPPNPLSGYRCWVQSTSVNRKLREKGFLYEVPEEDRRVS